MFILNFIDQSDRREYRHILFVRFPPVYQWCHWQFKFYMDADETCFDLEKFMLNVLTNITQGCICNTMKHCPPEVFDLGGWVTIWCGVFFFQIQCRIWRGLFACGVNKCCLWILLKLRSVSAFNLLLQSYQSGRAFNRIHYNDFFMIIY